MRHGRLSRGDRIAANVSPPLSRQEELPPRPQAQQNKLLTDRENENARYGKLRERSLASVSPNDSALLACPHGQLVLLAPFACTNLRSGIGILPQQTGVYVPRCLNQVNGSMTATLSRWPGIDAAEGVPGASAPSRRAGPWPGPHAAARLGERPAGIQYFDHASPRRTQGT
jgi:hypothetical protein